MAQQNKRLSSSSSPSNDRFHNYSLRSNCVPRPVNQYLKTQPTSSSSVPGLLSEAFVKREKGKQKAAEEYNRSVPRNACCKVPKVMNGSVTGAAAHRMRKVGVEWPKFSFSITKQEIEDDFIAMTSGAKPPRRPKRRPIALQRKLDELVPAYGLEDITPKRYEVDNDSKPRKTWK